MEPARNGLGNKTIGATIVTVATSTATTPASASTKQKFGNHTQKKNIKIDDERCITKNASKTKKIVKTVYTNEWADEIFEIKTKSRNNRNSRRTHTRRGFKEDKKQHKKAFYKSEILNDGEE